MPKGELERNAEPSTWQPKLCFPPRADNADSPLELVKANRPAHYYRKSNRYLPYSVFQRLLLLGRFVAFITTP